MQCELEMSCEARGHARWVGQRGRLTGGALRGQVAPTGRRPFVHASCEHAPKHLLASSHQCTGGL